MEKPYWVPIRTMRKEKEIKSTLKAVKNAHLNIPFSNLIKASNRRQGYLTVVPHYATSSTRTIVVYSQFEMKYFSLTLSLSFQKLNFIPVSPTKILGPTFYIIRDIDIIFYSKTSLIF